MKGYCIDNERRIDREELPGCFPIQDILGSRVIVKSLTGQNSFDWDKYAEDKRVVVCTVEDIMFTVSIDGKCFTLIYLVEVPDRAFTLEDLTFIEVGTL
jgi:hypothetical protein